MRQRAQRIGAALIVAVASARCSSSDTGSTSVVPPADAGTATDAGSTQDAGAVGGSDAGTGGTDAGSTGSDAGGGLQDAGSGGGGGSPDAGTGGGTPDGGTDAGSTASACDGLAPQSQPGAFVQAQFSFGQGNNTICIAGTSDGLGNVVVGSQDTTAAVTSLSFFDASGTRLHSNAIGWPNFAVFGQADGYIGDGLIESSSYVAALAANGTERRRQSFDHWGWGAEDPLGGIVEWVSDATRSYGTSGKLVAFDTVGNQRWSVAVSGTGLFASIGVDRAGNTLLLFQHGNSTTSFDGLWFSHDGAAQGSAFAAYQSSTNHDYQDLRLIARVGDGLFLQSQPTPSLVPPNSTSWLASFDALATHSDPAPAWLASRPNTIIHPVHGGTGYAMIPVSGQQASPCQQSIEVLAPNGESCGRATFKVDDNACTTAPMWVGYDGTVLQNRPVSRESCVGGGTHCDCTWHFWPAYFR
jgi:hypothetical protein